MDNEARGSSDNTKDSSNVIEMGGDGNHGLNPKTRILIETWILNAFKFFKANNIDRIEVKDIKNYIKEYSNVPLKLTDTKYRKGNLSIETRRLTRFLITLSIMKKVVHIPNTSFWKRINEEQDVEEIYIPEPKYCKDCNALLTPENKVFNQRVGQICRPCFLKKRRIYANQPHIKNYAREYNQRSEVKKRGKEYRERSEVKEHKKEYCQRPEVKERRKKYYAKNRERICENLREKYKHERSHIIITVVE